MRMFLVALALLSLSSARSADEPSLAIYGVDVQLQLFVRVFDADTRTRIHGARVTLVRAGEGKELALLDVPDVEPKKVTDARGVARFTAAFGGTLCPCGWVQAYTGNSFVAVTARNYSDSRVWVSSPSGRALISGMRNGKVVVEQLDTLRFKGTAVRRKLSYDVFLHRNPNA